MIDIKPGERVIFEVRRHWYVLLVETLSLLLFFAVPFVAFIVLLVGGFPLSAKIIFLLVFLKAAWFLLGWIIFFVIWTNYYLDVWIITDERIIDIEQKHLFNRNISEFGLDRVQDVTIEVSGFLPTLLHFGNIHVQTAGETRLFILKHVPRPDKVKDIIFKQQDEFMSSLRSGKQF